MPRRPTLSARPLGLSRVEFGVATALVGVLLTIALTRLPGPRVAARQTRLQNLFAATGAIATVFHGRCVAQGARSGVADLSCAELTLDGQMVAGVHGWPAASAAGIATALKLHGPTADIGWQPDWIDGVPAMRARLNSAGVAGTCEFIYAQAPSPGAAPRIELIDASCS